MEPDARTVPILATEATARRPFYSAKTTLSLSRQAGTVWRTVIYVVR
jgi:hypothetical protein